jgi:formylglycine-generating enzyme required for sulfatase activity
VITGVDAGSVASEAGLSAGDLIITLNGSPCGGGIYLRGFTKEANPTGPVPPLLARITSLNGVELQGAFDWINAPPPHDGQTDRFLFFGQTELTHVDRRLVQPVTSSNLTERGASVAMRLQCLKNGEITTLDVPPGTGTGLHVELTAYPLIFSPLNRLRVGDPVPMDPGSYLLVARKEGFEDLRFPLLLNRSAQRECAVSLLPVGTTPAGAVYIPPGPCYLGGDPKALMSGPLREVILPGFFMSRQEVTTRDWFEFVNDEETLKHIAESGETRFLPRDSKGLIASKSPTGIGYDRGAGYPQTPIFGVSWNDIDAFLSWRNRKAEQANELWTYDLPTMAEWEKAARGGDLRQFPWGDRFDHSLTVNFYRKQKHLLDAPGGFEPADESPFGIRDLAGSREEWTKDPFAGIETSDSKNFHVKGGTWGSSVEDAFRLAGAGYKNADAVGGNTGFRLVLRKRE